MALKEIFNIDDPVVIVDGLSKAYQAIDKSSDRLWTLLSGRSTGEKYWALKDVNFTLRRGQCLGLIGNNGAGKSTLLKLLAGALTPSSGKVSYSGRMTAILELGAGFHPEFSGKENLYFGGSLIGLDAERIAALLPSISEFSELGEALNRPVKTYSSGMLVRLAFSLVTAVEPDVLIIDEALAVGDQHFQKKCIDRINLFRDHGCTILFCSHSMYHIRQLCDVAIWMDQGMPRELGPVEEVLLQYESHIAAMEQPKSSLAEKRASDAIALQKPGGGKRAELVSFTAVGLGQGYPPLLTQADLVVKVVARVQAGEHPHFGVMLEQASGRGITSVTTQADDAMPHLNLDGLWEATLTFPDLPLFSGEYVLSAYLFDETGLVVYEEWLQSIHFKVLYPSVVPGLVRLPHRWS